LLRACEASGYDLALLQRRFGVGFEQLAHRLTTLQRVGQRGLPFFMARLDRAGQFSKRIVAASATTMLETGVACPLWAAFQAFERAGQFCIQHIEFGDGDVSGQWVTIARTVQGIGGEDGAPPRHIVVLGLETRFSAELAQLRGESLDPARASPIGPGCLACRRSGCRQRALPPRGAMLDFDERGRGLAPFEFSN